MASSKFVFVFALVSRVLSIPYEYEYASSSSLSSPPTQNWYRNSKTFFFFYFSLSSSNSYAEYQPRCGENRNIQTGVDGIARKYSIFECRRCFTGGYVCPLNSAACSGESRDRYIPNEMKMEKHFWQVHELIIKPVGEHA